MMRDRCRSNVTVRWHSYSSFRDDGSLSKDKGGREGFPVQGQCGGEIQGETSCLYLLTSNPGGWLCCAALIQNRLV